MDKIEQLYNFYLDKGLISPAISLDKFKASSPDQQQQLYSLGKNKGHFVDTTEDVFKTAWASGGEGEIIKKKEDTTVSVLEDGGLEQSNIDEPTTTEDLSTPPETLSTPPTYGIAEVSDLTPGFESEQQFTADKADPTSRYNAPKRERPIPTIDDSGEIPIQQTPILEEAPITSTQLEREYIEDAPVLDKLQKKEKIDAEKKRIKFEEQRQAALKDPEFEKALKATTSNTIKMDEENAVKYFTDLYSKFGFSFRQIGVGDAIEVLAEDGSTQKIDLQTFFSNGSEVGKLRSFIKSKAQASDTTDKELDLIDAEANKYFEEKGIDYDLYRKKLERYNELRDIIGFIESAPQKEADLENEDLETMSKYYINGRKRSDTSEILNELSTEYNNLSSFLNDSEVSKVSQDFDEYLDGEYRKKAEQAAYSNAYAKYVMEDVDKKSLELYGVPTADVLKMTSDDPDEIKKLNSIRESYGKAKRISDIAAKEYELAETFLDKKVDKNFTGKFVDGWEGAMNSMKTGIAQGNLNNEIVRLALGLTDISSESSTKEVAESLIKWQQDQQTGKVSRNLYNWNRAKGWREAFSNTENPVTLALEMFAMSFAQLLPTGKTIIPTTTAIGTGTGALAGTMGGPFAEVTVPAGAWTGFKEGAKIGLSLTSGAMEYGNAVMEAISNRGYDPLDPEQLAIALHDPYVWEEGKDIGLKRGVAIGLMDYIATSVAGRVFKAGKLATKGERVAKGIGGQFLMDPVFEGGGEFIAQVVAGQEVDGKEISAEMVGSFGSKLPYAATNMYTDMKKIDNKEIAKSFMDVKTMAAENISDVKISSWSNKMEKLGQITPEENQTIQKNVGVLREAKDLLEVGAKDSKAKIKSNPVVEGRLSELLVAKEELTSTPNRRSVFSEKISEINKEINEIATTGKIPKRKSNLTEATYVLNGKLKTKTEFINEVEKMSPAELEKSNIQIENDEEVSGVIDMLLSEDTPKETNIPDQQTLEDSFDDDEVVSMSVATLEEIPEQFRDRAEGELRFKEKENIAGLPIGKETGKSIDGGFNFTLTGKEIKEYAAQNTETVQPNAEVTNEEITTEPEATEVESIEPIKPSEKIKIKFKDNKLTTEETDGLLMHIALKKSENKKLNKFETALANNNEARMKEIDTIATKEIGLNQEVADLEALLKIQNPQFQLEAGLTNVQKKVSLEKEAKKLLNKSKTDTPKKEPNKKLVSTIEAYSKFVALLSRSFPNVEVITDQKAFDNLIDDLEAKKLLDKNQRVYGAVYQGKLYLNPSLENYNTPIHEFGHIWTNIAEEANPELYAKGIQLIEGSEYVAQIENNKEYQRVVNKMKEDGATDADIKKYILKEALATAIGDKGESFVSAVMKSDFKNWINKLFKWVKTLTGISKYTPEQLQNVDLNEFLQGVVVDLLSQKEVFIEAQANSFEDTLQLMTGTTMSDIIFTGRQQGIPDAAIKQVLLKRGFKATEINAALEVVLERTFLGDVIIPAEFGNMEGGMIEGRNLFNSIRDEVQKFVKVAKGATHKTTSEIRAKAQELLRSSDAFKNQPEQTQLELIVALDKVTGTRANVSIQKEITEIKNKLRQRKVSAKNLQEAKLRIRNMIRKAMPKSSIGYNQATVNRLVGVVAKATPESIEADTERVFEEIDKVRSKMKTNVIEKIKALVKRTAKKKRSASGKPKSGGVAYETQEFFKENLKVLKMILEGDSFRIQELRDRVMNNSNIITGAIGKDYKDLTKEEIQILNEYSAYTNFIDLLTMDLEDVQRVYDVMSEERKEGTALYKERKAVWADQINAINTEGEQSIVENFPEIIDSNGLPMDDNQLTAKYQNLYELYKQKKYWTWVKEYIKGFDFTDVQKLIRDFKGAFKNLETLTNKLDIKGSFFTDNIYKRLNRAEEVYLKGYSVVNERINEIANSIDGITDGLKGIKKLIYSDKTIVLNVRRVNKKGELLNKEPMAMSVDQLLRVYALYKDPVQREKLIKQGFDDNTYQRVEAFLDPKLREFADKVVNFLSSEYYTEVNDVYRQVNDVNLGFIPQYFPTQTIHSERVSSDASFSAAFNAEIAPSLKDRVDATSPVSLEPSFSGVLEHHVNTTERYKAYAVPTKILQGIFNNDYVKSLLKSLHLNKPMLLQVKYAINPNTGSDPLQMDIISKLQSKFVAFTLGLKLIQIPKQATSFINAFEEYSFLKKGTAKYNIPGLDAVMFSFDVAVLASNLLAELSVMGFEKVTNTKTGFVGPLQQAMGMSASFQDRISKGFEGDLIGLYSGQPTYRNPDVSQNWWGKLNRRQKQIVASPTVIGDIAGVMGYMVNYRRNIKNGMPKAEALEAFNNYNQTQQTRRPTEKTPLQMDRNVFTRMFTTFGSVLFLQMNRVMQSSTNLMRQTKEAIKTGDPSKIKIKDIRKMYINLGAANLLFVGMSNIFKLTGDDEDREEALKRMRDAMIGLNLLYKVPLIGEVFEQAAIDAEGGRRQASQGLNPVSQVYKKWQQAVKYDEENEVFAAAKITAEMAAGFQFDPIVAMAAGFTEGFDEEKMYDILGVSYSYRPNTGSSTKSKSKDSRLRGSSKSKTKKDSRLR